MMHMTPMHEYFYIRIFFVFDNHYIIGYYSLTHCVDLIF